MKLGAAIAEIMKREGIAILCGYPVNHLIEFAASAAESVPAASGMHAIAAKEMARNRRRMIATRPWCSGDRMGLDG